MTFDTDLFLVTILYSLCGVSDVCLSVCLNKIMPQNNAPFNNL